MAREHMVFHLDSTAGKYSLAGLNYNKKCGISPLMALKLANLFGTTPEFWMNAQSAYDLYMAYSKEKQNIDCIKKNA